MKGRKSTSAAPGAVAKWFMMRAASLKAALTAAVFGSLIFCTVASSEEQSLTLPEAIEIALKNNLSLSVEMLNRDIARGDIQVNKGKFDPVLGFEVLQFYTKTESPSLVESSEQRTVDFNTFLKGKMPLGTEYELKWTNERFKGDSFDLIINPYYSSRASLMITQPILKGFGPDVQKAALYEAENTYEIANFEYIDAAETIVFETIKAYWEIIASKNNLEVAELALRLARSTYDEVNIRIEAGMLSEIEIYKAEAEVGMREEDILKAEKAFSDALDGLRRIMSVRDWALDLKVDQMSPEPEPIASLEDSIEVAFNSRRDYRSAKLEVQSKERMYTFFQNQKLPDVSLVGLIGLNGVDENYNDSIDSLLSHDYYSWQVGIRVNIPLGNNVADGNFMKAKYELTQAKQNVREMENTILYEIREKWREVRLTRKTIDSSEKILNAAKKNYEAEESRFRLGKATLNDVLEFQNEYVNALAETNRSRIQFAIAQANFRKVQGVLLEAVNSGALR